MSDFQKKVNREQMVALQTLYSQWHAHTVHEAKDPRRVRIAWASDAIGRTISSFSELTGDEARRLIDVLKTSLGQPLTREPRPWRRIRSRDLAQQAGTAGRKATRSSIIQLASADDLARIQLALDRLGWSRERYTSWLNSAVSPVRWTEPEDIYTVAEANRIWWALKKMLKRAGLWSPDRKTPERNPGIAQGTVDREGPAA